MDEMKFDGKLEVGQILVSSWGWEQTNVDWYQVVKAAAVGKFVGLVKIPGQTIPAKGYSPMAGDSLPVKLTEEQVAQLPERMVIKKKVKKYGSVVIERYADAYPWDGKPKYVSWYA
jgi:hypothetical protein